MGLTASGAPLESSSIGWTGSGLGVSSTVECLPVVHGGMLRNSSKVSTRGLQHFQPDSVVSFTDEVVWVCMKWARRHLSVLHGTLEDRDGKHILPRSLCMTCRSPCGRTSESLLATRNLQRRPWKCSKLKVSRATDRFSTLIVSILYLRAYLLQ